MVIIWCYLADQDDPVFFPPQETLNKMNISNELKQVLQATLNPDPSKRPTLQNLLNLLSKIPGYDQSFKLNDLKDTKKAHTSVVSVEITVEEAKLKPIHAKLIYHICSLLHKLSATDVFENLGDQIYDLILHFFRSTMQRLKNCKAKDSYYELIALDINRYAGMLVKYYPIDSSTASTYPISWYEVISILEQKIKPKVKII